MYYTTSAVSVEIETGNMGAGGAGGDVREREMEVLVFDTSCAVRQNNQPTNCMPAFCISYVPHCPC